MGIRQTVVSPILVGRTLQVEALTNLLQRTSQGSGRAALLGGEAGAGKSRLLREMFAYATPSGMLALRGACFESDRTLPYAPLLDLARSLLLPTADIALN